MKSVLISIQPKWCELIVSDEKTIEVRKTAPKLQTPFKCYAYCTTKEFDVTIFDYLGMHSVRTVKDGQGMIIGEFVCDRIEKIEPCFEYYSDGYDLDDDMLSETCLTREELMNYGKGKLLYGWYISDLKIYDKPKELGEFKRSCDYRCVDGLSCKFYEWVEWYGSMSCMRPRTVTRPPQSWCYVEELK